jgi:dinuclear metal center YbgI/SA1388 family protein
MKLAEFSARLDDRLDTDAFPDASANGLQVGPESKDVSKVAFAVDGVEATFEAAAEAGADVLVCHHGIVWGGISHVTGQEYDRLRTLITNDLALYVSHAPLDAHLDLGNAAGLCDFLDLEITEPFGEEGGFHAGQRARAKEPYTVTSLKERLEDLPNREVHVLDFGPERIEDVAVLTGSGTDWVTEARAKGVDALVTGEGKQPAYHEAREAGIHVFLAGHYATEIFGVQALQSLAEGWGLETTYIEHPTGL